MSSNNPKINKYLDIKGNFSHDKSEIIRSAYKDSKIHKPGPIEKLFNAIFKKFNKDT